MCVFCGAGHNAGNKAVWSGGKIWQHKYWTDRDIKNETLKAVSKHVSLEQSQTCQRFQQNRDRNTRAPNLVIHPTCWYSHRQANPASTLMLSEGPRTPVSAHFQELFAISNTLLSTGVTLSAFFCQTAASAQLWIFWSGTEKERLSEQ